MKKIRFSITDSESMYIDSLTVFLLTRHKTGLNCLDTVGTNHLIKKILLTKRIRIHLYTRTDIVFTQTDKYHYTSIVFEWISIFSVIL